MKIDVHWWKATGRWYANEEIALEDIYMSNEELKQFIVDNQTVLLESWILGGLTKYVTVTTIWESDDEYRFHNRLFMAQEFAELTKSKANNG